ncbi:hypothetical protein AAHE18_06G146600 [Arachis hypogaea]|nr:DNA mismatch repair protein [Arachis hypogaea]
MLRNYTSKLLCSHNHHIKVFFYPSQLRLYSMSMLTHSSLACGLIHMLLSQLANRFEHLNSWNTKNEFKNKKKSRFQPCPAYILNISCLHSFYDLTFESSKTWVQFKDWDSILNSIEKVIKEC